MTFLEHLEELRKRIFYSLIALGVGSVGGFIISPRVVELLTRSVPNLVFLAPSEALVVQLKVALITGAIIASPVIFYQFWRFVRPALLRNEARYIALAVAFSTIFFLGGMAFAYFLMVPIAMKFLLGYETEKLHAMLSIKNYVGTVGGFLFATGIIFQTPVVIFFLTKLGIITPRLLVRSQRAAIVVILIVAGIVSPPDVFSQLLMAVPMLALFYLSILGSFLAAGRRRAPEAAATEPG